MHKRYLIAVALVLFVIPYGALAAGNYTWTDQTTLGAHTWSGVASSADGTHLVAIDGSP